MDGAGWPWIFYINVPVALVVAVLAWRTLAAHETATERTPVDFVGLALLITWVGAMQIMLDKGKDLDWFGSPFIVALALVATVGFIAFLIWELTEEHPAVDLRVFRHRGFATAAVVISHCLRCVLLNRRAAAALAADESGLHGDLGGQGDRFSGRIRGRHVADRWTIERDAAIRGCWCASACCCLA